MSTSVDQAIMLLAVHVTSTTKFSWIFISTQFVGLWPFSLRSFTNDLRKVSQEMPFFFL